MGVEVLGACLLEREDPHAAASANQVREVSCRRHYMFAAVYSLAKAPPAPKLALAKLADQLCLIKRA